MAGAAVQRSASIVAVAVAAVSLALSTGCKREPLADGLPERVGCSDCHGAPVKGGVPPALDGATDPRQRGVGAHALHVNDTAIRAALACGDCHVVPDRVDAPGHVDPLPAEVTFGTLAGAAASWDGMRCAGVYCHGATLAAGGSDTQPRWTFEVLPSPDRPRDEICGTCHGHPPPPPHPQSAACWNCHPETVRADGTIDVAGGHHIDGVTPLPDACDGCHGANGNPAPPRSISGVEDPADPGVGAHAVHLSDTPIRGKLECSECHPVPTSRSDALHVDGITEVAFGTIASGDGASVPAWNARDHACSGVSCHGAAIGGPGSATWPLASPPDFSRPRDVLCASCHGYPPATHVTKQWSGPCQRCHPQTVTSTGDIDLAGGRHIDGAVEAPTLCNGCHGNATNAAPPTSTLSETSTGVAAVGAHQVHLRDTPLRSAIPCSECHLVPATRDAAGHLDPGPAEVTFGTLARTRTWYTPPAYDRATGRCNNVYCHGGTMTYLGGSDRAPRWTLTAEPDFSRPSAQLCGRCHGWPPLAPHRQQTSCDLCHPMTVTSSGAIDVAGGKHMNGVVDAATACNACHGSATSAAPPRATDGSVDTLLIPVGAHEVHVTANPIRGPIPCSECHLVPAAGNTYAHNDAPPAEVQFGTIARTDAPVGSPPAWLRSTATCEGVYCHGARFSGTTAPVPIWTLAAPPRFDRPREELCGSCHGYPPPPPHEAATDCQRCHPQTVLPSGDIDIARGQHIDGTVDACSVCHGSAENAAPPRSVADATSVSSIEVGAHQIHVRTNLVHAALACSECHVVPERAGSPGHIDPPPAEVAFGPLSRNDSPIAYPSTPAAPVWDRATATCSDVYCHGSKLNQDGFELTPSWVMTTEPDLPARTVQERCGRCHRYPPVTHAPFETDCYSCHEWTVYPDNASIQVGSGTHINGYVEVCDWCHN